MLLLFGILNVVLARFRRIRSPLFRDIRSPVQWCESVAQPVHESFYVKSKMHDIYIQHQMGTIRANQFDCFVQFITFAMSKSPRTKQPLKCFLWQVNNFQSIFIHKFRLNGFWLVLIIFIYRVRFFMFIFGLFLFKKFVSSSQTFNWAAQMTSSVCVHRSWNHSIFETNDLNKPVAFVKITLPNIFNYKCQLENTFAYVSMDASEIIGHRSPK